MKKNLQKHVQRKWGIEKKEQRTSNTQHACKHKLLLRRSSFLLKLSVSHTSVSPYVQHKSMLHTLKIAIKMTIWLWWWLPKTGRWKRAGKKMILSWLKKNLAVLHQRPVAKRVKLATILYSVTVFNIQTFHCCAFCFFFFSQSSILPRSLLLLPLPAATSRHASSFAWAC